MAEALTIESEAISPSPFDEFAAPQFMRPNDILWPLPPAQWFLGATDVHIWAAHLDLPRETLARLAAILSREEQGRAARFRFETHRDRFIAARGVLRSLLAKYLERAPHELQFEYGPKGKPTLAIRFAESGLFFNLTHSENLALVAVTRLGPIGVDVEQIRSVPDTEELVARFFSARENALFQTLPANQKNIAFFNLWTRKEAWLKATGEGIGHLLNRVEVTFLPGEPAQLLFLPAQSGLFSNWALQELKPAKGFIAAVALSNVQFSIFNFQFLMPESL